MNWTFRKSKKVGPLRVTLGKGGLGISAGVKGLRVGIGPRGPYTTVSLPGTGLRSTTYHGRRTPSATPLAPRAQDEATLRPPAPSNPWIFVALIGGIVLLAEPLLGALVTTAGAVLAFFRARSSEQQALSHVQRAHTHLTGPEVRLGAASLEIEAALAKDPHAPLEAISARALALSTALEAEGQADEAAAMLERLLESMSAAAGAAHARRLEPRLGLLHAAAGRTEAARPLLERAAAREPEVYAEPLARAYVASGEPKAAVALLQGLGSLDERPELLLALAEAFVAAGYPALAIETLQRAPLRRRTLDPTLRDIHYLLGRLFEEQGARARALQHYRRVASVDAAHRDVAERLQALG